MCMLFRLTVNDEAGCSTDAENGTRARRLQLQRERKRTARQSETDEERARRLQLDRERKCTARQSDTNEEQARRLQLDRERKRTARQSETDEDRKSTRLNSSHTVISYAVFCLKKKKQKRKKKNI